MKLNKLFAGKAGKSKLQEEADLYHDKDKFYQNQEQEHDQDGSVDDDEDHKYNEQQKEPQEEPEEEVLKHDIFRDGPATELSNDILSYERFFPGRILGNTFSVTNRTNEPMNIKVSFTPDGINKEYVAKKLMEFYEVSKVEDIEKPYPTYLSKEFIDSQEAYSCWCIEDPYAKNLVKEAKYELKPHETFEFIIVLKSPIIKKTNFLITNVRIANLDHDEEHRVFAFGSLDVPKLSCPKEIMDKDNNYA